MELCEILQLYAELPNGNGAVSCAASKRRGVTTDRGGGLRQPALAFVLLSSHSTLSLLTENPQAVSVAKQEILPFSLSYAVVVIKHLFAWKCHLSSNGR